MHRYRFEIVEELLEMFYAADNRMRDERELSCNPVSG
jgi:hypothetical protein